MRKFIIGLALASSCSVASAQVIHHHYYNRHGDGRVALGVLGGIAIASALNNRYIPPPVVYSQPGWIGPPPVVYSSPPIVYSPPVQYVAPPVAPPASIASVLDTCRITVYNPHMNRNEEVSVTCRRNYQ